jgi:hypothetical protein
MDILVGEQGQLQIARVSTLLLLDWFRFPLRGVLRQYLGGT